MRFRFRRWRMALSIAAAFSLVAHSRGVTAADLDLTASADARAAIEAVLANSGNDNHTRAEMLVMAGRSRAASGDFELSAAAYIMFLEESGDKHPYCERISARLVDSLAPLDLQVVDVVHSSDDPRFDPVWRMNAKPTAEQLRQAVAACEYAAALASEPQARGSLLLKSGWIQRALGDWPASTLAFERCMVETPGTPAARRAIRLASENLHWTGHPADAADLLRRLRSDAGDESAASLAQEIEMLDAEASRNEQWLADPVAGLQSEIDNRANQSAEEVFREAMNWLAQRGDQPARLTVARWGMSQSDWSLETRMSAHLHAADALLAKSSPSAETRTEAADVLGQLIDIASSDHWLISTAMRRSALLRDIGAPADAVAMWEDVTARLQKPNAWSAQVLPERIKASLGAADRATAKEFFEALEQTNPEHSELGALRTMLGIQEEGK